MTILVIGLGSIGSRHLANLRALGYGAQVVGADPEAGAWERARVSAYADWRLALLGERIDAAVIASPTAAHLEQMAALAKEGIPFLVEKPMCQVSVISDQSHLHLRSRASAVQVSGEGRSAVGFCYRFHPVIGAHSEELRRREVMEFWAMDNLVGRYGPTCAETMGSHSLDLALWLFGAARRVRLSTNGAALHQAQGTTLTGEIEHESGQVSRYQLRMDWRGGRESRIVSYGGTPEAVSFDLPPDDQMYVSEMRAFMRLIETGERDPRLATLAEGWAVMEVLAQASDQ